MTATTKRATAVALTFAALAALPGAATAACSPCTSDGPIVSGPGPGAGAGPVDPGGGTSDGTAPVGPIFIGDGGESSAPTPLPVLTPLRADVLEGDDGTHDATVDLLLAEPAPKGVSFDWHTADLPGGAVAGEDYVAASGHVAFSKGQTDAAVLFAVIADDVHEGDEPVAIEITNVHGAQLAAQGVAYITNDDARPRLTIDDTRAAESAGAARLRVWLSGPSAGPVDVAWTTPYDGAGGTVHFAPGETEKQIVVPVADDHAHETDETFAVTAAVTGDVDVARGYGLSTIVDDDPATAVAAGAGRPGGAAAAAGASVPTDPVKAATLTASKHGLRVRLLCPRGPGACRGTVKLTAGTLVAGVRSVSIESGQTELVTIPLSQRVRRSLARHHRLQMLAHSVLRRADGTVTRYDSPFTVRPSDIGSAAVAPAGSCRLDCEALTQWSAGQAGIRLPMPTIAVSANCLVMHTCG